MGGGLTDAVKQQVAAHWNRRAPGFDDDFGHSIRTPAERAAWDRIFALVLADRRALDALDVGCGTGFLTFELASRGHRVTGVDFAAAMIAEARRKAAEHSATVRFEEGDAEQLPFAPGSFDLVMTRHVLWTLPAVPPSAGELVDSHLDGPGPPASENARTSPEYRAVGDQLPFLGGRPREVIEKLLTAHGLVNVGSDPLLDLVAAQEQRMAAEGKEPVRRRRYVVWGDTRK